jgi:threonine aldolase
MIDLRSDTVTRPDAPMYEAMRRAPLGDDVFGDDPTTRRLEETAAAMLGKEAGLFVPSGTMGNQIAIAIHTQPGDEAVVEAAAHSRLFEVGGAARLWGVQLAPLEGTRGVVPLAAIRAVVRPGDIHIPRTRLLLLEQTNNLGGGCVLPLPYLQQVGTLCRELGLRFHLDGARIFNAAVAARVPVGDMATPADTVMFCLSKGLGAPAGSMLVGPKALLAEARRVRKLLGGGLRQAGILAAAGLHALEHNVDRLAEDHATAAALAALIEQADLDGVEVEPPETNMVYVRLGGAPPETYRLLVARLAELGVLAVTILGKALRLVVHKDVSRAEALQAGEILCRVVKGLGGGG